jgi:hypothetical protein
MQTAKHTVVSRPRLPRALIMPSACFAFVATGPSLNALRAALTAATAPAARARARLLAFVQHSKEIATQPLSCTAALAPCARSAATTASIAPAAAAFAWLSVLAQRLPTAAQPLSCTAALAPCARSAATTASVAPAPPAFA